MIALESGEEISYSLQDAKGITRGIWACRPSWERISDVVTRQRRQALFPRTCELRAEDFDSCQVAEYAANGLLHKGERLGSVAPTRRTKGCHPVNVPGTKRHRDRGDGRTRRPRTGELLATGLPSQGKFCPSSTLLRRTSTRTFTRPPPRAHTHSTKVAKAGRYVLGDV